MGQESSLKLEIDPEIVRDLWERLVVMLKAVDTG
jgi:hypothetical protein